MMIPVRYSGRSGSNSQARANISAGPTTQTRNSVLANNFRSLVTVSSWS